MTTPCPECETATGDHEPGCDWTAHADSSLRQITAALAAMDIKYSADPDYIGDSIGTTELPDLIGMLASTLDEYASAYTRTVEDGPHRWASGYLGQAGHGDDTAMISLGALALRLDLTATVTGHWAARGNQYARGATIATRIAAALTGAAAATADRSSTIPPEALTATHKGLKTALRDLRGILDAIERHA